MSDIEKLQEKYSDLELKNSHLNNKILELEAKNAHYEERLKLLMHQKFVSKSERVSDSQLSFFDDVLNEVEAFCDTKAKEPELEEITYKRRKKCNDSVKADLPVEETHYTLDESEQICDVCNHELHEIGTSKRDELVIIPATFKLQRHITHNYGCKHCETHGTKANIKSATAPTALFKGSMASESAVSEIMVQKYMNAVPLYRQEQYFKTLGINLSRQNMSNWLIKSTHYLEIIYKKFHEELVRQDIIHADETTVQVLKEPNRKHSQKSYMWLYKSNRHENPIVLYDYQPSRSYNCPKSFLNGFNGYLQTDGYAAYGKLKNITQVTCLAHIRRKFDEALTVIPDNEKKKDSLSYIGFSYCQKLYNIEKKIVDLSLDERQKKRQAFSVPIFEGFELWLKKQTSGVLPKSYLGKAINYASNQLPKLKNYLNDPRLEIDNNSAERSIKPFVVGRKNWLFSNTPNGAKSSAIIYSIIETAKMNDLKVFDYLCFLLANLKNTENIDLNTLLPWDEDVASKFSK